MNWVKGFFENGQPQSMSDLLALIICFGGLIYCFSHSDYMGGVAIMTIGAGIKAHKNFEGTKRVKQKEDN